MLMLYIFIRITFTKYFTYFHTKAQRIEMELISLLTQIQKKLYGMHHSITNLFT